MTLTQKENSLLSDLKSQEKICIEKYGKYEKEASDATLKNLFSSIKTTEENHLSTICRILNGEEVAMAAPAPKAKDEKANMPESAVSADDKARDAFLCADALAMEKHVSSVYDIAIFEFSSPTLRDTLNHIQKEEQNHGKEIYDYMSKNNMYS
jgi:spore coat protein CotF